MDAAQQSGFDLARFKRQLAETIAWCLSHGSTDDVEHSLRTSVPSMPDTLYFPDDNNRNSESRVEGKLRRQRGYETFFAQRAERLKIDGIRVSSDQNTLAGGRLLVFEVENTLNESAMYPESDGFFDELQDGPPWDTWVYYDPVKDLLIWWAPPLFLPYVEAGMSVMTVEWIWWLTGSEEYEFAKILKREGFLG